MKKLILIFFLFIISCSSVKVVNNHGLTALENKSNKIELYKTTKKDIIKIIGKPSSVSLFDENYWYFIEREHVNQSMIKLGKSKLEKNNVLELKFNNNNVLISKKLYNIDDMNSLKKDKTTTTKAFDDTSKIQKLIKSLEQKINAPKQNRKRN
tara:strand:- start:21 stop:479 length:459 start_codon:yes stop_codon:yes gene_type:complete